MTSKDTQTASELESRRVAEASRQTEWTAPSFLRELFLGSFRLDLVHPFPPGHPERADFQDFFARFKRFMNEEVDPVAIDETGEYPPHVVQRVRELGGFGLKIPKEYGGLGCSQQNYNDLMVYLGAIDGNIAALLSAHQSIGVPQPIKLFGTAEQKQRLLPRLAAGSISAFALTEAGVGSDPAKLATTAEPTPDGEAFILNGEKLWCTNGTLAELLVVMARNPQTKKISAFVVDSSWPGVEVTYRSRFMGLRALANGLITFRDVRVPRDNLIGKEGHGLKIALVTLNTGRLTLPATSLGAAIACLEMCRRWASLRQQWGLPIGHHEAIAHKISDIASTVFAMTALNALAARLADTGTHDIRLEAAAAKEWNTTRGWRVVDEALQVRGGRGYETERSLSERGDAAFAVERLMRDSRINTLFEGSSEVMHLFIAREAVDRHLQIAGAIIDPEKSVFDKLKALPRIAAFYARWYPSKWLGWGRWPRYGDFGRLATHLRFVERRTRKLARTVFHGMVIHGAKLQRKQAFLFRVVDIGLELGVMANTVSYARYLRELGRPEADSAYAMADLFCRGARRRIDDWLRDLWSNHDDLKYRSAADVLAGKHTWLEEGIEHLRVSDEEIVPRDFVSRSRDTR